MITVVKASDLMIKFEINRLWGEVEYIMDITVRSSLFRIVSAILIVIGYLPLWCFLVILALRSQELELGNEIRNILSEIKELEELIE